MLASNGPAAFAGMLTILPSIPLATANDSTMIRVIAV
jgi:hypothetical protein